MPCKHRIYIRNMISLIFLKLLTASDRGWKVWECENMWLVGGWPTPLKNMTSSVGMMKFPTEWKVRKFHGSKPPTRCGLSSSNIFSLESHWTFLATLWINLMSKRDSKNMFRKHEDTLFSDISQYVTSSSFLSYETNVLIGRDITHDT